MSVLVRGMDMPESCWDCYFYDCGNCVMNSRKVVDDCIIGGRRDDDCPLVYIPPHGRLIDVDALGAFPYNMDFCDGYEADEWVQNAPTIIESEGKA